MGKQSVKVIIRTRPTPNFATKNIQIDPINSVSLSSDRINFILFRQPLFTFQKTKLEDISTMFKRIGNSSSTK